MGLDLERARWWSWRRQRLDRSSRGVEDCLRSVVGVYSSNPQGPLSLLARVPRLMRGAAVEGVVSTKRAVRLAAMRRSIYLIPTDSADLIFSATRLPERPYRAILERAGIGERAYDNLRAKILSIAERPVSAEQIRATLPRAPKVLTEVLQFMCAQGVLLRINSSSIRTNDLTYAATEAWLGRSLKVMDEAEALAWLAGDYLSAFGPVRPEDFAWWTGKPLEAARAALLAHDPVDVGDAYLHRRDVRAFEGLRPMTGRVNMLPKWDCYTMGYAPGGRARLCDPALDHLVYDSGGNAGPVVLVEGQVGGTWSIRLTPTRAKIDIDLFGRPGPKVRASVEEEAALIGTFLEARGTSTTVEIVRPARRKPPAKRPKPAPKRGSAKKAAPKKRAAPKKKAAAPRARRAR